MKNMTSVSAKFGRSQSDKSRICSSEMLFLEEICQNTLQSFISCACSSGKGKTRYRLAVSKQMVGLFLCVWVQAELYQYISNLKVSCVGRGLVGYMGNKGSVSISMAFCKENKFLLLPKGPSETILSQPYIRARGFTHSNIVWLGDLNYRLVSGCPDTVGLLKKRDWESLLDRDQQLLVEQKARRVFHGWQEGEISFPLTYKYINSDHYAYDISNSKQKNSCPAWCDRILWRGKGMKQMSYATAESRFSDHRPVYSIFFSQIEAP